MATLLLLVPAALELPTSWPSPVALSSIGVLGVVCTALVMLLMFYLVRQAGASRVTVIPYVNPLVATLLGVLVLHEQIGIGGWLAFALDPAGVLAGNACGASSRPLTPCNQSAPSPVYLARSKMCPWP